MLFIDRQLPSVRAIGMPNRLERVATRKSQTDGDREPAADAVAFDGGDRRHANLLEPVHDARDAPFVRDAVVAAAEIAKARRCPCPTRTRARPRRAARGP